MKQEKTQHKTTALVLRLLFSLLFLNSGKSYSQKDTVPLVPATPKVFASLTIGEVVVGTKIIETSEKLNIMDNEFLELRLKMEDLNELNSAIHYKYRIIKPNSETEIKWIETNNPIIIAVSFIQGNHVIEIKPLIRGLKNPGQIIKYSFCVVSPFFRGEYFNQLILIIMLSIIIFGLWTQRKFVRTRSELSKTQISLLRGALNPHMIFNSLNTLQKLFIDGKEKEASIQISHFTKFLRYNLNNYSLNLVPVNEEIKNLKYYLELEKIRYAEKLDFKIDTSLTTDLDRIRIPSLILQPIAENSIVHGNNDGLLLVSISTFKQGKSVVLSIKDNGGGIKNFNQAEKEGHGLSIVKQIIFHFNKTQKAKIKTRVINDTLNGEVGLNYQIIIKL